MTSSTSALLVAAFTTLAPAMAWACKFRFGPTPTHAVDFLWIGIALAAAIMGFAGHHLAERPALRWAAIASSLLFGVGVGLHLANDTEAHLATHVYVALAIGAALGSYPVKRRLLEYLVLSALIVGALLASSWFVGQTRAHDNYTPPTFVF